MARVLATLTTSIPSPDSGVWYLGPLPLRAYALFIILGIFVGVWWGERRWVARGGRPGVVQEAAIWAVPFGIVGARIYHVLTSPEAYFGEGGDLALIPQLWRGGLGIWGAVAGGALGIWVYCRRNDIPMPPVLDVMAPALPVAQAIGRLGNYFNQELFGKPTTLPWGLEIDPVNRPPGYEEFETFHPTFLYEAVWNLGLAAVVVWAERRFRLGHGRAFALYVAGYTLGRVWVELLRIDPANLVLGLRLNVWTSLLVFAGAVTFIAVSARRNPGREDLGTDPRTAAQTESEAEA